MIVRNFVSLALIALTGASALGANNGGQSTGEKTPEHRYNEVFDHKGNVRPQYRLILPAWSNRVHHMQEYAKSTFKEFKRIGLDSNAVNDLPRMISKKEYADLTRGVHQRERAIQAFLRDHYSGTKTYAKNGIVSEELVNKVIVRNGENGYQGLITEKTPMNYLYGPDVIRGPDGVFRALEDNLGFVGGVGDIVLAQRMSERLYPEIAQHYTYPKALEFFQQMNPMFEAEATKYGGKVIMYGDPKITDDSEDQRTVELFRDELGMEVVTPKSKRRLSVEQDGVYVQDKDGKNKEKVGFVVLNVEHADLDLFHPATFEKAVLESAANFIADKEEGTPKQKAKLREVLLGYNPKSADKLKTLKLMKKMVADSGWYISRKEIPSQTVGLLDAMLDGRVGSSYMPGAEFVGDKEMYTYIESFIRFYLNEEPIIRNVETYMFNKNGSDEVNEAVLDRVFGTDRRGADIGEWVIKPVDGRGGDGITFGKEVTPDQIPALIAKIKEGAYRLQAQKNTPPSLMVANRIIDTRALTYSTREKAIVSPVPWSRAATVDKSRLINVSSGGAVNAVFVIGNRKSSKTCEALFR